MIDMVKRKDKRPGGSNVKILKDIPDLHRGTKHLAEKRAKAEGVGGPSRMPKPEDQLRNVHHPGKIVIEDTNPRVIKERKK